jgi:hypothetical protein
MSRWRDLGSDFGRIDDPFSSMRADWSQYGGEEKVWRIAAFQDIIDRQTFEVLAKKAGNYLLLSPAGIRFCSKDVFVVADPIARWLTTVAELTKSLKTSGHGAQGEGENSTLLLVGSIDRIIENSALACLHLDTEEKQLEDALSGLREKPFVFLDDIDSFEKVQGTSPSQISDVLQDGRTALSEDSIQKAIEEILSVPFHKKDWGGEENDLYTANVLVRGVRIPTAFLLKGPAVKSKLLQIADCGKNGDQIVRLFQSPAELFVVQYAGEISEAVLKDLESKVIAKRSTGSLAWYCAINGQDTARLLKAYGKL